MLQRPRPGLPQSFLRRDQSIGIDITQCHICISGEVGVRKVVPRTDTDVEVLRTYVLFEEGEQSEGGGAAPEIGVADAEDPEVVD